ERFATVTAAFDRRFDSRSIRIGPPTVAGARVVVTGVVLYTLSGAPLLELPFSETATYRGAEIVHLEDASSDAALTGVSDWMARYGDRLRRCRGSRRDSRCAAQLVPAPSSSRACRHRNPPTTTAQRSRPRLAGMLTIIASSENPVYACTMPAPTDASPPSTP